MIYIFVFILLVIAILIFIVYKNTDETYKNLTYLEEENKHLLNENADLALEYEELKENKDSLIKQYEKEALEKMLSENASLVSSRDNLIKEIKELKGEAEIIEIGLNSITFDFENSATLLQQLKQIRQDELDMIRNKEAVEGSEISGIGNLVKLVLRAFNNECDNIIDKVTYANAKSKEMAIQKSYEAINKLICKYGLSISLDYLDQKIEQHKLAYEYKAQLEIEKELLREAREKERENKKAQAEINQKLILIKKEISILENNKEQLLLQLISATEREKEAIQNNINTIQDKISLLTNDETSLKIRKENTGAGIVYVISNIGSFGENVYKIGVTRRENPMDRISELSSASVPFKFDLQASLFSLNAYELERQLHNTFNDKRINLVNSRKEFFKVPFEEIKSEIVKFETLHNPESSRNGLTMIIKEKPDALEYKETLQLQNQNA